MNQYIALFRGINIGGKHLLPMKELVGTLGELGCQQVRTYIQSGNVVFRTHRADPDKLAQAIGSRIRELYDFEPAVLLLDVATLRKAIRNNPFPTQVGKALHFFFLSSQPSKPEFAILREFKRDSEEFELIGQVFYLYTPEGVGQSKLAARVERSLGVTATARNWNTVRKLVELAEWGA